MPLAWETLTIIFPYGLILAAIGLIESLLRLFRPMPGLRNGIVLCKHKKALCLRPVLINPEVFKCVRNTVRAGVASGAYPGSPVTSF